LGWFGKLNASKRNCSSLPSTMGKFFNVEKSQDRVPGPIRRLRVILPYAPFAGSVKAGMLNQPLAVWLLG
jgi:hypothetical protein